ncbi:MAG TPA: hypothetical protein V6D02_04825, partial [Candidatus Obscuribacterales bacterium]
QTAMDDLFNSGQLPSTVTARFQKLVSYGIGGGTLYKYKTLWHPNLWKTPQTPQTSKWEEAAAMATPATASYPTSLLLGDDGNSLQGKGLSRCEAAEVIDEVRNGEARQGWRQRLLDLKLRRSQQKIEGRSPIAPPMSSKARLEHQQHMEKMASYLRSRDPILMKAGLEWLLQQDKLPLATLIPTDSADWPCSDPRLATLVAVCEQLLRLGWTAGEVRASWGGLPLAALSWADWQAWLGRRAIAADPANLIQ